MFLKNAFEDHALQEKEITSSSLDWTIVRPANLTDGLLTGTFEYDTLNQSNIEGSISRADVADCMLRLSIDKDSIGEKYWVSY